MSPHWFSVSFGALSPPIDEQFFQIIKKQAKPI